MPMQLVAPRAVTIAVAIDAIVVFFWNLLPHCHQPISNALFIGKIWWWQLCGSVAAK